jgi:tetratricopeptide (TPR) repeat protein
MNKPLPDIKLKKAIQLREEGHYESSKTILLALVTQSPSNAAYHYHCAWTHDAMGLERDAVQFYEKAMQCGLEGEDLAGAYLGLGSTLRGLGHYEQSEKILSEGFEKFPEKKSIETFLAMALYNRAKYKESVSRLLKILIATSADKDITQFGRAILHYAADLDFIESK